MKSVIFTFYFCFLFIFCAILLYSQTSELKLNHIGLEHGLSQSTIYTIVQDAQGFMWFGSQDGLNRYDGYSIEIFKHNATDNNSIADNSISCLLSDPGGNLWIGTFKGGLDRYSITENKFYHHFHNQEEMSSISSSRINVLFRDSGGNIWVGTNDGLDLYDKKRDLFTHYFYKNGSIIVKLKNINAICEDRDKMLWVGSADGLFNIALKDISKKKYLDHLMDGSGKPFTERVGSAFADVSGMLWIGMEDNLLRSYSKSDRKFFDYKQSIKGVRPIIGGDGSILFGSLYSPGLRILDLRTKNISLISDTKNDLVNAIFVDNTGIIWVGTYFHGVYSYDYRNNRFRQYPDNPQNPDVVMSILEDHEGGLWVGTFGNGIKYFNKDRDKVVEYHHNSGNINSISSNKVMAFTELPDSGIYIGTIGGGLDYLIFETQKFRHYKKRSSANPDGLSSNDITALYKDLSGKLWIGYYYGEIDTYDKLTGRFLPLILPGNDGNRLTGATITFFREDKNGTIWIGTHGNGLLSYKPLSGSFKKHLFTAGNLKQNKNEETVKGISTLYIDINGILWIGSDEAGLIKYDPLKDSYRIFTFKKVMAENTIYGILPDSSDNLWLSTNNGLVRFNTKSEEYRIYDKFDGLQANEFNQGAYYMGSNGELFFGGVNGFNSFFPKRIEDNENIPPVYFTSFKVFDKVIPLTGSITSAKNIVLSYAQNFFSFEFVALNYTLPQKNKYSYMLKGFDQDWHTVSAQQRFASYTNLDPGNYTLVVKASNNDGVWNESGTSLNIIINPPFWMTLWFRLVIVVLLVSIGYALYKYRILQMLKIERMRFRIANDLHDEMGSDLSAIALASQLTKGMDQNDQLRLNKIRENSLRVIDKMREIVWFIKPEHDSSDKLLTKIKEVTETLLEGKKYELKISNNPLRFFQDIESRQNLFLIYKECLTNIIRHSGCSEVKIELGHDDSRKLLSISDNGIGFDIEKARNGSGLNNLMIRAARLKSIIKIKSSPGNGTSIELFSEK